MAEQWGKVDDFNSRPYTRGDVAFPRHSTDGSNFNSRPYTRGDLRLKILLILHLYFNSRPYTRGDLRKPQAFTWNSEFQLSPLHEGRRNVFTTF